GPVGNTRLSSATSDTSFRAVRPHTPVRVDTRATAFGSADQVHRRASPHHVTWNGYAARRLLVSRVGIALDTVCTWSRAVLIAAQKDATRKPFIERDGGRRRPSFAMFFFGPVGAVTANDV